LPGKRGIGQIFRRGRGTDGEGGIRRAVGHQLGVVIGDFLLQLGREGSIHNPLTYPVPGSGQGVHVIHVQFFQLGADTVRQTGMGEKIAVSLGRGGKAAGHTHFRVGQLTDHFAQGGILAADALHVTHPQLVETDYVIAHVCS